MFADGFIRWQFKGDTFGEDKMLQAIRRLSKVLAYGYAVYLSLRWYPRIGTETIFGDMVTRNSYWLTVIGFFILAWIVILLTDWIFANKERNTAIPEQVEPIFSESPSAELSTLKPSLAEEHEVTVVQPELTLKTLQALATSLMVTRLLLANRRYVLQI